MVSGNGFSLALRLARRELRGGVKKFLIFLACLALGVGAVTALGTLSESVRQGLQHDARIILGGDMELARTHVPLGEKELEFLAQHADVGQVTRLRTMARTSGRATLAEIKGVDAAYPLFGTVTLDPAMTLTDAFAPRDGMPGLVAESGLLSRLGLAVGDTVRLGRTTFRINAQLVREPDRAANFFGLGPRVLLNRADLASTGLILPGAVVRHIYKLRLHSGIEPVHVRMLFNLEFPDAGVRIRDFSDSNTAVSRGMERMTSYLALVGLAALLIGGIGAAGAVRGYLADKLGSIAAMKCVGASRKTILAAYLLQITALALAGSVAGIIGGVVVAWLAGDVLAAAMQVPVRFALHPAPMLTALACGLATAVTFSLRPLFAAVAVTPARLFRGYADPQPGRPGPMALALTALGALALTALAVLVAGKVKIGLGFIAGALIATAVLRVFTVLLARGAQMASRATIRSPRLRHALANIHRPGAPTMAIVFSLGLGLTALAAVVLVQGNIRHRIEEQIPEAAPSFFFLNIQPHEIQSFAETVTNYPGITRFEYQPSMRARITHINSVPTSRVTVSPSVAWALRNDRGITFLK